MDLYDHAGLLKSVRDAKQASDLTIFTIHAHESPTGMDDDTPAPPNFLKTLFPDVVDAGADVVVGGGPHSLRGIELYKGKPIFYGIGVFRSEEHTSDLQSPMRNSYAVFCLNKQNQERYQQPKNNKQQTSLPKQLRKDY